MKFVAVFDHSEGVFLVDAGTFRQIVGETAYQLQLAEKANRVNDARVDLAQVMNDPLAEPAEYTYCRKQYANAVDDVCRHALSLREIAEHLGINDGKPHRLTIELTEERHVQVRLAA